MRICGIDIKASESILALIDFEDDEIAFVSSPTKRVSLNEDDTQESVKLFFETMGAFLRNNQVDLVAIKKRNKKGEYAGGPTTFKIEGLIQMIHNCDVHLVSPQTVAASVRKHAFDIPQGLLKYQVDAYLTACCYGAN
jgi:hypothetical protein